MRPLDAFVRLYTAGLEARDETSFVELLRTVSAGERTALLHDLSTFLAAERARLVKLKTLGLTAGYEEKIRYTEGLLSWVRGERQ